MGPDSAEASPDYEGNLARYLECEALLGQFFGSIDFCVPNCLSQQTSLFGGNLRGDVGCCPYDFHRLPKHDPSSAESLLAERRFEKYGLPDNTEESCSRLVDCRPCSYHTADGCILEDHKSPTCIAFLCAPYKEHLQGEFGIYYVQDDVVENLEGILKGAFDDLEFQAFKAMIFEWIRAVQ